MKAIWNFKNAMAALLVGALPSLGHVHAGDGHGHAGDFIVGRTGTGQLAVEFDFAQSSVLPPVMGALNGFALDDPGFLALEADEPEEEFFTLGAGADIVFEVVSFSPALSAWMPGFGNRLDQPGEQWMLGGSPFDEHPTWHVDSTHPAFDLSDAPWLATFRLVDHGTTGYTASDEYTARFVPEPGSIALLGIGAALVLLRRRWAHPRPDRIARGRVGR